MLSSKILFKSRTQNWPVLTIRTCLVIDRSQTMSMTCLDEESATRTKRTVLIREKKYRRQRRRKRVKKRRVTKIATRVTCRSTTWTETTTTRTMRCRVKRYEMFCDYSRMKRVLSFAIKPQFVQLHVGGMTYETLWDYLLRIFFRSLHLSCGHVIG